MAGKAKKGNTLARNRDLAPTGGARATPNARATGFDVSVPSELFGRA